MIGLSDKNATWVIPLKKVYNIWWKNITFETWKLWLLAQWSVTLSDESGNVLLVTAGIKEEWVNEKADFFPLVVDYQEKFYATWKIGWNRFAKREWRPSEASILTSRLIDRPIRPMFPKGFINDTQIIATALSSSNESDLWFFGITWASLSLLMTWAPFEWPVAWVRIILNSEWKFIFDPSFEEEQTAKLNLLVAWTLDAITMVESSWNEVSQDEMMSGLKYASELIKDFCNAQNDFISDYKKQFWIPEVKVFYNLPDETLYEKVEEFLTEEKLEVLYWLGKIDFHKALIKLEEEVENYLVEDLKKNDIECDLDEKCDTEEFWVSELVYKRVKKVMRKNILENDKRLDLRKLDEVRSIKCETWLLPRVHGSGLFQRGMTQVLSITTLWGPDDIQIVDDMYEETTKRYIHHYNFPPFSVWEVRMLRWVWRREVWHGKLAERALEAVLPSENEFPYMIRVVSETMTCNWSSSMASVCGSTLSLMQAGVPIKAPVAGIAMWMIYDEESWKYKILSDIQAQEDFLWDMDFKVTMSPNGITAMQLDVKISGLSLEVFEKAFTQARTSINFILDEMLKVQPSVAPNLSPYAPLIMNVFVPVEKIREVIWKWWENVQRMEKEYSVKISIAEDGNTTVTAKDQIWWNKAVEEIKAMVWEPEVGYKGVWKVAKIIEWTWAIVEFSGKSWMIHISKLAATRVVNVADIVKEWESVEFEVIEVNKEKWRIGLKRKFDPLPPKVETPTPTDVPKI